MVQLPQIEIGPKIPAGQDCDSWPVPARALAGLPTGDRLSASERFPVDFNQAQLF